MSDRVWVVNYAGHDYSKAKEFGEIRFITRGYVSFDRLDRLLFDVTDVVDDTAPSDWLLPSGLVALNILAAVTWFQKHDQVNLLIWDHREENYRPMTVSEEQVSDLFQVLSYDEQRKEASQREAPTRVGREV